MWPLPSVTWSLFVATLPLSPYPPLWAQSSATPSITLLPASVSPLSSRLSLCSSLPHTLSLSPYPFSVSISVLWPLAPRASVSPTPYPLPPSTPASNVVSTEAPEKATPLSPLGGRLRWLAKAKPIPMPLPCVLYQRDWKSWMLPSKVSCKVTMEADIQWVVSWEDIVVVFSNKRDLFSWHDPFPPSSF